MPSPFSRSERPNQQPGVIRVVDSVLVCDRCFDEVAEGDYYEEKKLLVFVCENNHVNKVRIDLSE